MTLVTLVFGGSSAARQAAIAAHAPPGQSATAIIEGLPSTSSRDGLMPGSNDLQLLHIAPGCPCCTGNLNMRVTLNRTLRKNPGRLYLSLANSEHLSGVINFLQEDQYRERMEIGEPVDCSIPGTGFADAGY